VLEAAADRIGYRRQHGAEHLGIACGFEKGSYIATAVTLTTERNGVHLRRIVSALDCGAVVNPNGLKNQIEGALVQGIGGALFEAVRFERGRIGNATLARYRVPRFTDVPSIDIVLVEPAGEPSAGAGETPLIALAPAIGNALFHATGTRLRSLPLRRAASANDVS
jgi:isoquinoline 1-oxidoreductase